VKVAEHRSVLKPFEVFHFSGHTVSGQQWLDAVNPIARAQGWVGTDAEVRNASFPWKFIRLGAPLVATWKALLEMRYLWDTAHTLDNRKLVALLGEEPHTPLNAALLMTLRDLGYLRNMANMANMGTSE
jgi:nucleoside-diphosphate-sugar epimerase